MFLVPWSGDKVRPLSSTGVKGRSLNRSGERMRTGEHDRR